MIRMVSSRLSSVSNDSWIRLKKKEKSIRASLGMFRLVPRLE